MSDRTPLVSKRARRALWIILTPFTLLLGVICLFFLAFPVLGLAKLYHVPTNGMAPTVVSGDRIYAFLHRGKAPARGQITVFHPPHSGTGAKKAVYIQRCVGLPGDTLEFTATDVLVNSVVVGPVPRPYRGISSSLVSPSPATIPADSYFMLGDNHGNSLDSRYWGYARLDHMLGKGSFRLLPPGRFGRLR